jgi:hypothetical protein
MQERISKEFDAANRNIARLREQRESESDILKRECLTIGIQYWSGYRDALLGLTRENLEASA